VQNLIDRQVRQLGEIERTAQLKALLGLLAARSGQLTAAGSLESELQISRPTVARYMSLLEVIYLISGIPGWSRNLGTRATATPKLMFVDSGIAARLLPVDSHARARSTDLDHRSTGFPFRGSGAAAAQPTGERGNAFQIARANVRTRLHAIAAGRLTLGRSPPTGREAPPS
jgi:predicted AAA+ superfamily ATPase